MARPVMIVATVGLALLSCSDVATVCAASGSLGRLGSPSVAGANRGVGDRSSGRLAVPTGDRSAYCAYGGESRQGGE